MYSSLGAPSCLSQEQAWEAARLCNCKRYGTPSGPIHGFGQEDAHRVGIDLQTQAHSGCSAGAVRMPPDFDPSNPCEALARGLCPPRLTRPTFPAAREDSPADDIEQSAAEQSAVDAALTRQSILVFGVLGAVLVGAGYMVYRVTRS